MFLSYTLSDRGTITSRMYRTARQVLVRRMIPWRARLSVQLWVSLTSSLRSSNRGRTMLQHEWAGSTVAVAHGLQHKIIKYSILSLKEK